MKSAWKLSLASLVCVLLKTRIRLCAEEESNIGFHEVSSVVGVNRGFGAWGDMVVTLDGGDKLEMRSVPECDSQIRLFPANARAARV